MDLGNGLGHLTYSTLVHPGDNWEQMWASLNTYLPKVKARFAGNKRFGVSLRLSADSAQTLVNSQAERDRLKKFLTDHDMYLYTVNAFPYGAFKGTVVKEQVYEPDWRSEERTRYTMNVASVLVDVCPAGIAPSIQSAPLGFKPRVTGGEVVTSYTDHVLRVVAHLVALVEHLDLLHLIESFRESTLGVFQLALEVDRRAPQILAPLDRGLGVGRVREMRRIVNAGALLLRLDLAIEVAGDSLEFADHDLDLSDLAALLIDLEPLQANERLT